MQQWWQHVAIASPLASAEVVDADDDKLLSTKSMFLLVWFVVEVWYGFNERIARSVATPHKCLAITTKGLVTVALVEPAVVVAAEEEGEEEEEGARGGLLSRPGRPGT